MTATSSTSTFYTFDFQGNTTQRFGASANVIGAMLCDAFGNTITTDSTTTDPYSGFGAQFGYYKDFETGFVLMTHRYYDPSIGRFLTRDPIGYAGGINLYGYTGNNPINRLDPSGLDDDGHNPLASAESNDEPDEDILMEIEGYLLGRGSEAVETEAVAVGEASAVSEVGAACQAEEAREEVASAGDWFKLVRDPTPEELGDEEECLPHAAKRAMQGRPVHLGPGDAMLAGRDDVYYQEASEENPEAYIVRRQGREHLFNLNGDPITSIVGRSRKTNDDLVADGIRRLATESEYNALKNLFPKN